MPAAVSLSRIVRSERPPRQLGDVSLERAKQECAADAHDDRRSDRMQSTLVGHNNTAVGAGAHLQSTPMLSPSFRSSGFRRRCSSLTSSNCALWGGSLAT